MKHGIQKGMRSAPRLSKSDVQKFVMDQSRFNQALCERIEELEGAIKGLMDQMREVADLTGRIENELEKALAQATE